jgi:hypothetical protein
MSDLNIQRVIQRSITPTTPHKINLELGNRLDRARRYSLRMIKSLEPPRIKVRNLPSLWPDYRVIKPRRASREELEGPQTNSSRTHGRGIEDPQMNSRSLNSKVIESLKPTNQTTSKVLEGLLLNKRQKGDSNVLELLQTMVNRLFDQDPLPTNEVKASTEAEVNLKINRKIKR